MTGPLDPVTITFVGIFIAIFFPIAALLFAILALAQGNIDAAILFGIIYLLVSDES